MTTTVSQLTSFLFVNYKSSHTTFTKMVNEEQSRKKEEDQESSGQEEGEMKTEKVERKRKLTEIGNEMKKTKCKS